MHRLEVGNSKVRMKLRMRHTLGGVLQNRCNSSLLNAGIPVKLKWVNLCSLCNKKCTAGIVTCSQYDKCIRSSDDCRSDNANTAWSVRFTTRTSPIRRSLTSVASSDTDRSVNWVQPIKG